MAGLCRALLRQPAEAEDAAQQVFLSAHRALMQGTEPREPAAWLATIARNECWARIRNRMREPLPTADVDQEKSLSDPLTEAVRNADLAAMWTAIAALPLLQRDALLLREFGGLSYDELAQALSVSGSAVESLLFRARQGVRTRVQTAYAGITGASWVETLARLAGGIGGGMAPVAAKVAVVGVGAAVATGSAVVAPRLLDHPAAKRHVVPRHVTATRQVSVAPAQPSFVSRTSVRVVRAAVREGRTATTADHRSNDDAGELTRDDSGRAGTARRGGDESRDRSDTTRHGGRTATSEDNAATGAQGSDEKDGSDSGEGSGRGRDATTTTTPTTPEPSVSVDVPIPTTAAPAVPLPRDDG